MKILLPVLQPRRSELQIEAINVALKLHSMVENPEKDRTMYCPYCGSVLTKCGMKKYETLDEHVSCVEPIMKQGFTCTCEYGKMQEWNEYGESYSSDIYRLELLGPGKSDAWDDYHQKTKLHIYHNALNTFEASSEAEIYKNGLKKTSRLWPWLTLNKIQLTIDHHYKANDFGIVTKHWITIGYNYKAKKEYKTFNCQGTWPWHTYVYLFNNFKQSLKQLQSIEHKLCIDIETIGIDSEEAMHIAHEEHDKNCLYFLGCMFRETPNRAKIYQTFEKHMRFFYNNRWNEYQKLKEKYGEETKVHKRRGH